MKSTAIVLAIAAASLGFSTVTSAQGNDRRGTREEVQRVQQDSSRYADQRDHRRYDRRDVRRDERRADRRHDRRDDRNYYQGDARRNDRPAYYYNARGPDFRRGGYVPHEYRNRQYIVSNYRAHRLYAPPRGQQWVQVGPDYVLVAIATGLIMHAMLN